MNHWKTSVTFKFDSWKSFVSSVKEVISKAMVNPILLLGVIAVTIFFITIAVAYEYFYNHKRELLVQIVAESFGIVLDIGVLGILMIWITAVNDKKRKISEAIKEIDDLRFWGSDQKGEVEMGKNRYLDSNLEIAEVTLRRWQIGYAALKIVRNIKTLAKAGIQPIDLNHCQVPSSNLSGLNLADSNLDMVNMSGCKLSKVVMDNATACSGNFKDADLSLSSLRFCRANGADFTNSVLLQADCCYGHFINTSFVDAQLHEALFINTNLKAADFRGATLVGVNFSHATGLTAGQLNKAKYVIRCILPEGLEKELDALKKPATPLINAPQQPQYPEQRKAI
jgi:uncharacterized protein YjbI with pentapeptide repeats